MVKIIDFSQLSTEREQVMGVEVGFVFERVQGVLHVVQLVLKRTEGLGDLGRGGGEEGRKRIYLIMGGREEYRKERSDGRREGEREAEESSNKVVPCRNPPVPSTPAKAHGPLRAWKRAWLDRGESPPRLRHRICLRGTGSPAFWYDRRGRREGRA